MHTEERRDLDQPKPVLLMCAANRGIPAATGGPDIGNS
jgi:hypothetical protein